MAVASQSSQSNKPLKSGYFEGKNIPDYEKILNCVRCGMCLPHCPTYSELKMERASPRGRAALVRAVADGRLEITSNFTDQMYLCLDCRACETACPSGVHIGYLIESARSQSEQNLRRNTLVKLFRNIALCWLFKRHWRLELVALPLRIYQKTGLRALVHKLGILKLFPKRIAFMEALPPDDLKTPFRRTIPDVIHPRGEEKARVGYFLGCMMSIMFNKTTSATVNVLNRSGCTVITPKAIRCCGAPLMSEGFKHKAVDIMRFNIDLFDTLDVDYIVTDCAACGAALKEYKEIFEDDPEYHGKAARFSGKVREITQFLAEWPHTAPVEKPPFESPKKAIYDQPCHLCHAQQIWEQPKKVIQSVPGVEFVDLPESEWCCGSAGIYNVTHYGMAMRVLDRKMNNIEQTGADLLLTANPGCLLQLRYGVNDRGLPMEVKHIVELLDDGTGYQNGHSKDEKCQTCGRKPRPECR